MPLTIDVRIDGMKQCGFGQDHDLCALGECADLKAVSITFR